MTLHKHILILLLLFPIIVFGQEDPNHTLKDEKLKKLEVEIKYSKKGGMHVDNPFKIVCIATKGNGNVDVAYVTDDDNNASYDLKVVGAELNSLYYFVPSKYCESYADKEMVITVTANGRNSITEVLTFKMNCTPDPAIIAQKEKEKQEELQRLANVAKEKERVAREKTEIARQVSEGGLVGVTIPENTVSSVKLIKGDHNRATTTWSEFYETHDPFVSFHHLNTVEVDNEILLLGSAYKRKEDEKKIPAIYKLKNDQLVALDIDVREFPLFGSTAIRDVEEISDTEILVLADNGILKMVKTPNGYRETSSIFTEEDTHISFTDLVSLGNGKCASIGYSQKIRSRATILKRTVSSYDYAYDDMYKEERDQGISVKDYRFPDTRNDTTAYMVIWDYNTGEVAFMYIGDDISEQSVLARDKNGNLIFSLGYESNPYAPEPEVHSVVYKSTMNSINCIDIEKSFENKRLEYIWSRNIETGPRYSENRITFVVADIIVEDNGDIVFTAISREDELFCVDKDKRNHYSSSIGIGRLSPDGGVKNWYFDTGINISYWGGSNKGDLELALNPGKVYYSGTRFPKLMLSPDGKGYIMTHSVEYDEMKYPKAYLTSTESDDHITEDPLLFVYLSKKELMPVSFDLLSMDQKYSFYKGFMFYNSSSKKYTLLKTANAAYASSFKVEFQSTFNNNWLRKPTVQESKGTDNGYDDYLAELGTDYQSNDVIASDVSSGSSSSSTAGKSKYVTIYNKTGKDIYYVEASSSNPTRISANGSDRVDCSENYWYTYDANDGINGGNTGHPKLYNADSGCGDSITIE